jgi:hypothetical protein
MKIADPPSFLIIGVAKAATTWTQHQLQSNPALYLPDPEPQFFSRHYEKGPGFYADFFTKARSGQIRGEKSASYFAHPRAAKRISEAFPDAALILQLRDPIERAYSHYKMLYRRGTVRGRPEEYLLPPGSKEPRLLNFGLYAEHLARWYDHFDPAQLQIILHEDLRQSPERTVRAICAHIQAPEHYSETVGSSPINDSSKAFLPFAMRSMLAPFKPLARPLRGNMLFETVRGSLATQVSYPPLSSDLRTRMLDYFGPDIEVVEKLIGRNLRAWLDVSKVCGIGPS